jgi:hypothetical protein
VDIHNFPKRPTLSTGIWKRLICVLAVVTVTVSAQVTADTPRFTDDEIAIYCDFLLHYPEQLGEMIGMQDTTEAFVASMAFGDEPNPPNLNLEIPAYSGGKLPPEVMVLTDEKAMAARAAAEGKLVYPEWRNRLKLTEIVFDSKHAQAVFVYSSMRGKGGSSGTVVYELKNGQWTRKGRILNFRIA